MKAFTQKFLSSIETRFQRSRAGSVLIIVIVLLLLLAILGAAYISTTRSSRVASAQNVLSSDVDSTLNGIAQVCQGVITDDLNDTFGNLRGNTAYVSNTTIVNRSYYQGQAGTTPLFNPNVPASPGGYNVGDIVNDVLTPSLFYSNPQGGGTIATGAAITPSTTPGSGWQLMNGHLPITAYGTNQWLADRFPDPTGTAGFAVWQYLTQSIQVTPGVGGTPNVSAASILGTPFEDPITGIAPNLMSPLVGAPLGSPTPLIPTYETLSNGVNVPALQYGNAGAKFTAMDADGDGIADSIPFRVPGMSVDGFTWYAGVRIIDNNSAINANTAWSRDQDYVFAGSPPAPTPINNIWNLFQTSVGLQELLNAADIPGFVAANPATINLNALNAYRFNDSSTAAGHPLANYDPLDESAIGTNTPPAASDRGLPANASASASLKDYNFISEGEAFYQQFIRRIANPGYNTYSGGSPPVGTRYLALPLSDEASLAHGFCLVNPETTISQVPSSVIESLLPHSLWKTSSAILPNYRSIPYGGNGAADVTLWYDDNFNYARPASSSYGFQALRPLLVTRNPVSNYIQQIYNNNPSAGGAFDSSEPILPNYMLPYGANTATGAPNAHFRGIWSSGITYSTNDIVIYPGPVGGYTGPSNTYIAVATSAGLQPDTLSVAPKNVLTSQSPAQAAVWQLQPWSQNPVKANVNTATFRELFRAFWCVMAGNPSNVTPFGTTAADLMPNGIYDSTTNNFQYMFRSPLRDSTNSAPATATQLDTPPGNAKGLPPTYQNTMLLRAALAAVNTIGLRDNAQNIISKTIILNNAWVLGGPGGLEPAADQTPVEARVYSNAPQPIISEVYVNTDTEATGNGTNQAGYVAIELFNPYPISLSLVNWKLAFVNRPALAPAAPNLPYPQLQLQAIATLGVAGAVTPPTSPIPIVIPPYSYVLLENYNAPGALQVANPATDAAAATYRPSDTQMPPNGIWAGPPTPPATPPSYLDVYVPYLENVIAGTAMPPGSLSATSAGGELVLLRPRRADGTITNYFDPVNDPTHTYAPGSESFNENNLWDLVPIDSYDFTNLQITVGQTSYYAWSYIRGKGPGFLFKGTYPGQYVGTIVALGAPREAGTALPVGVTVPVAGPVVAIPNGTQPTWNPQPSAGGVTPPYTQPIFGQPTIASYPDDFPPVQIYNVNVGNSAATKDWMHFPNSIVSPQQPNGTTSPGTTTNAYPFGGFARNGDMLDIPFIGAYRIRALNPVTAAGVTTYSLTYPNPAGVFLELNSVTMDCSLAAITDVTAISPDPVAQTQNIGRFVPMASAFPYVTQIAAVHAGTQTPPIGHDYYSWTANLFNYLTVQSSTDAYLPNVDPNFSSSNYTGASTFAYPPQNTNSIPPTPALTANAAATDQTGQDNVGIEGLVNINTASWKVLSMLPFVPNNAAVNQQIAQNIVAYRLKNGPFTSIFDLNQVPGFQNGTGSTGAPTAPPAPTSALGMISPADPNFETAAPSGANTGITEDYQWDCLTLDRISNLITTRSDTFTVYIVLQGWQNAGSTNPAAPPQPMVTRRFAYIVDRSQINSDPSSRFLKTLVVPND